MTTPAGESWPTLLTALLRGQDLDSTQTAWAMRAVMSGDATPVQVAGLVVALRAKGETPAEVTGLAATMLEFAAPLSVPAGLRVVDTCGTGGDRANTVNISTMAAVVVAGTGAHVVKHGNRSASSACGSADVLEELGVVIDLAPEAVGRCIAEGSPAFCFAPVFHPSMRHAAVTRRELAVPTVFNILGPLTNPARPQAQVVGVADPARAEVIAGVLAARNTDALVVHGDDGLDELTTATTSRVWWVREGTVSLDAVDPARLGLVAGDLVGGDAPRNAAVMRALLTGETGPVRDAVLLNSAAALVAYEPGTGTLHDQLERALATAARSIDSGAALAALTRWVESSNDAR